MNNPVNMFDPDGRLTQAQISYIWNNSGAGATYWGFNSDGSPVSIGHSDWNSSIHYAIASIYALDGGGGGGFSGFGTGMGSGGFGGYTTISYWTDGILFPNKDGYESIQELINWNIKIYDQNTAETDWHETSQTLRKWSGYAFSANKFVFQPAAERAVLYGGPKAYSTTNLVFEKTVLGRRIYQPLMEMNAIKAQRFAAGTKIAGRVLGGAGIILAGVDINQNGVNMSNSLDLVMSVLAVSPTGWGQAIAGGYFLANGITTLLTGKDIGQHIEAAADKYYNNAVRAEEQRKFNAAMGY